MYMKRSKIEVKPLPKMATGNQYFQVRIKGVLIQRPLPNTHTLALIGGCVQCVKKSNLVEAKDLA